MSIMSLESTALARFDKLVLGRELLWQDAPTRIIKAEPFNVRQPYTNPSCGPHKYTDR